MTPIRPTNLPTLRSPTFAALALGLIASSAQAAFVVDSTGDPTVEPFFVSQAYFGASTPDSGTGFVIQEGVLYDSNVGPRPRTATLGSYSQGGATMTVDAWSVANGFYSARNYVSMSVANAQAVDGYYAVAGYGTRTQVEFFTPDALAARSVWTWRVTGTETEPIGWVDSRLDFLARPSSSASYYDVYDQGSTWFGTGTRTYTLDALLNQPIDLFFWSSAFTQLDRGVAPQGSNTTLVANYGSTYELVDIDLFDAGGDAITNWWLRDTVTGAVVFDETGRLDTSVPAPATTALLGLGALAIGLNGLRRRERRVR